MSHVRGPTKRNKNPTLDTCEVEHVELRKAGNEEGSVEGAVRAVAH